MDSKLTKLLTKYELLDSIISLLVDERNSILQEILEYINTEIIPDLRRKLNRRVIAKMEYDEAHSCYIRLVIEAPELDNLSSLEYIQMKKILWREVEKKVGGVINKLQREFGSLLEIYIESSISFEKFLYETVG